MEIKTPFDAVNCINNKSTYEWSDEVDKVYVPFIVNRAMSNFQDTIYFANEANKMHHLDKDQQFDFYYGIVPKGKRYSKWNKTIKATEDEKLLQDYFGINILRAQEYLKILTPEQLNIIRKKCFRGGVK